MSPTKLTRRLSWTAEGLLLAGTIAAAAWLSSAQEWQPLSLLGLLPALALVAERLEFEVRGQHLSAPRWWRWCWR